MNKAILFVVMFLAASISQAADISVTCKGTLTSGTTSKSITRQFEFFLDTQMVEIYQDTGTGMTRLPAMAVTRVDDRRITPTDTAQIQHYIDRMTGQYFLQNRESGVIIRGSCDRSKNAVQKF